MCDYIDIEKTFTDLSNIRSEGELHRYLGERLCSLLGLSDIFLLSSVSAGRFKMVYPSSFDTESAGVDGVGTDMVAVNDDNIISGCFMNSGALLMSNGSAESSPHQIKVLEKIRRLLDLDRVHAVVPLFIDDVVSIICVLGEMKRGGAFTENDFALIRVVCHQAAAALKVIRLKEEKRDDTRLMSLGLMSASITHAMRNAFTSLKAFAQLFLDQYEDPAFRESFSRIVPEQMRIIECLIRDLPAFSVDECGVQSGGFNLTQTIDASIGSVRDRYRIEGKSIVIEKQYGDVHIPMTGSPEMLKYALIHVIENGCEAMENEGVLKVDIQSNGVCATVFIEDHGDGIPEAEVKRIFDPFYTTKSSGRGLGLTLSKRMIESYDGEIKVKSSSTGTLFSISLPVQSVKRVRCN